MTSSVPHWRQGEPDTELQRAVIDAIQEQERLRGELRTAARRMYEANSLLSAGMKAGVGEAKAILTAGNLEAASAAVSGPSEGQRNPHGEVEK